MLLNSVPGRTPDDNICDARVQARSARPPLPCPCLLGGSPLPWPRPGGHQDYVQLRRPPGPGV